MYPLGGWIFGCIADTRDRKESMSISMFMICAGSLLIAVMPTVVASMKLNLEEVFVTEGSLGVAYGLI